MIEKDYLVIDESQTIASIQKQFSRVFPFLKIEFFNEPHVKGMGSKKKKMYVTSNRKINAVRKVNKSGKISLNGNRTVQELETDFQKQYELSVQVFRKSGSIWLETTATDGWSLEEQNEEGKNLQLPLKTEKEDFNDHDVW